jgi:Derlin-2/3
MSAFEQARRYYNSIPVVSRALFTLSMSTTILTYFNFVSPYSLIYSLEYIKNLELWRVLTTFFYWGPATIDVIIHQIFFLRYSIMLEESFSSTSDYLWMISTGMLLIFFFGNALKIPKMSSALSTFITYVWTKKNPMISVQYLGLVAMPAYYIPYVMCVFSFLMEKRLPKSDIAGIVSGHTYFYFKTIYPRTTGGRGILSLWASRLFSRRRAQKRERERKRIVTVDDIREE